MEKKSSQSEADRMFSVIESGHAYQLHNIEGNEVQKIQFIQKEDDGSGNLVTVKNGTTNEAMLQVLLDRLEFLYGKLPDPYTRKAIDLIDTALATLEARTAYRKEHNVEGTNIDPSLCSKCQSASVSVAGSRCSDCI